MGVIGKLNALDERAGVRGPVGPKRWEARLRLWWLPIVSAYVLTAVGVVFAARDEGSALTALPIALLPGAFYAGFLYNERLRRLGTRPRMFEVPAEWPEHASAVAPPADADAERDVLTA